jgi:hypothetical protein
MSEKSPGPLLIFAQRERREREREGERVEEMEEVDFRGGDERGQNDV